jgi:peptidyl-prolyl cis-trans isomerase A (cyclophilin A)
MTPTAAELPEMALDIAPVSVRRREVVLAGLASMVCLAKAGAAAYAGARGDLPAASNDRLVRIVLRTAVGRIDLAIDVERAPLSAADFLRYVDQGLYAGGGFYRVVRPDNDPSPVHIAVVQGGVIDPAKALPPVAHEPTSRTGILHKDGVISLARNEVGTGSATAFFICLGDQPELDFGGRRHADGQGFAAFGRVLSGMQVVRRIGQMKVAKADAERAMSGQMLRSPVRFLSVRRT